MREANLFTMLSAYQPGSTATPFENYCTSGLAYLLIRGHSMLTELFRHAAGTREELADVEVQPRLADAGIADLVLTFEGGLRVVVDVQVEPVYDTSYLDAFSAIPSLWDIPAARIVLGLDRASAPDGWAPITWDDVVEALDGDPDPLAAGYRSFVLTDVLGEGPVALEAAITSNQLYAMGGAAIRRHFGMGARYANAAARPMGSHYRYVGTMFSTSEDGEMDYWIGIVNETVPLGEHYQLILASKTEPLEEAGTQPRALGDWKWNHWTGIGRVVRPMTPDVYDRLLARVR